MGMNFPRKRSKFREWSDARNKQMGKFIEDRGNAYGPLGKQLDLLWHDMDSGAVPGKNGRFYAYIASVKASVRKPEWDMDEYVNYDFSKETFEEDLD